MPRRSQLVAVALALATLASIAPSAVSAEPDGTTLRVSGPIEATVGDTVELVATLTDAGGEPVAGVQLLVEERVGFFDTKASDVLVTSAATNDEGVAVIRYFARRDGALALEIRFVGNRDFTESAVAFEFTVADGPATYTVESPPGIPGVNRFVVILVLVAVWGTMLVVAVHVAAIARVGGQADVDRAEIPR